MPLKTRRKRNITHMKAAKKPRSTTFIRTRFKMTRSRNKTIKHRINWKKVIGRLIVLLFQLKIHPASLVKTNTEIQNQITCAEPRAKPSAIEVSVPKLIGASCAETKGPEFRSGSLVKAVASVANQMCPTTRYTGKRLHPKCIDPIIQSYTTEWANKANVGITRVEKKDPAEDMCKEGTLCKGTLGIPRILMPSLDNPTDFLERIKRQFSITHVRETAKMSNLLPAQGEIRRNRVENAAAEMNEKGKVTVTNPNGSKATASPIIISQDNYIVDGHHRWAATHEKGLQENYIPVIRIMAPIRDILMASALEPTNPF